MLPRFVLLFALAVAPLVRANEVWTGVADVKFRGYSTLHDFEGTVKGVPLQVAVTSGANGRVVSATSNVEVKDMTTANEKRDSNMWAMFQQAKFRFLKIQVTDAEERTLHPGGGKAGLMPVVLTIAGQRGTVNAAVTNIVEAPARVSFDLAFRVSLKAFSLDPPKSLGGLVQVKDTVDVTVHVVLKKDASQ